MTEKLATINIKGKEYTMVKDRIVYFNETYPNGSIVTELVSPPNAERVVIRAIVTPDVGTPSRVFIDYSQAVVGDGQINRTSALENASTSAVGRALAYMGIGVIESVASADEVKKAISFPRPINTPEQVRAELNKQILTPSKTELADDARACAIAMENFVPLTDERHKQIQDRLGELTKTGGQVNRRRMQVFLEKQHDGKKAKDVPAEKWEATMKKIEDAVTLGEDAVKALMKGEQ